MGRMNIPARAWGWPSARRSWSVTAAGSGSSPSRAWARRSRSRCPQAARPDMDTGGVPIEILLVEDNPGDARLTREAPRDAKGRNNLAVAGDGVEAPAVLRRRRD